MNCIHIFFDALVGIGTLALAFFTYKSVEQSKHMSAAAKESIDLTKKIEKSKIKPYCIISPLPENADKQRFGTCPETYFINDHHGPKMSCIVKNYGPGPAHAVSIFLGGDEKKLWTKRILVADLLAPGDQIEFKRQFTEIDLPSSELREFPRTNTQGRREGQPEYLCSNIKYAGLEYSDSEKDKFHAIRLFVSRRALSHPVPFEEPTDAQKFSAEMVEMVFFDGPHEDRPFYSETEEEKAERLSLPSTFRSRPDIATVPIDRGNGLD
ncbi:hypothetical protein AB4090_11755 [Acidithiobacillus sp. IBUN Pt1247-S3]|uniref:hypothetical protein n=1 Tax=Acidithiobacillus sp. IBUN Pt1247-S3 TaxID=3166642 RepID=UPI0034E47862